MFLGGLLMWIQCSTRPLGASVQAGGRLRGRTSCGVDLLAVLWGPVTRPIHLPPFKVEKVEAGTESGIWIITHFLVGVHNTDLEIFLVSLKLD